jgi:hypothetical protein
MPTKKKKSPIFKIFEPADPGSKNPYLRTYPAKIALQLTKARARRRREQLENVIRAKVTKKDFGKILFFDLKGKRITKFYDKRGFPLNKKLFAVRVTKKTRTILNRADPYTKAKGVRAAPEPQRLVDFDTQRMEKFKTSYRQYRAMLRKRIEKSPILSAVAEKDITIPVRRGELTPVFKAADDAINQLFRSTNRDSIWKLNNSWVDVKLPDGSVRRIPFDAKSFKSYLFYQFKARGRKRVRETRIPSYDLVRRLIYGGIANSLRGGGYIAWGSVRRVSRLSQNRGKPMSKWKRVNRKFSKGRYVRTEVIPFETGLEPVNIVGVNLNFEQEL